MSRPGHKNIWGDAGICVGTIFPEMYAVRHLHHRVRVLQRSRNSPVGEAAPCAACYLTENGSRVVILQKEGKILGGGPSVSVHDYIERQSCRRLSVAVDK